jgi:hypothetical protein
MYCVTMARRNVTALAGALAFALALAAPLRADDLTWANYRQRRDYIVPKTQELGFRSIPWRSSYWEAVVEAQVKEKPILLWTMNGHPLGCT